MFLNKSGKWMGFGYFSPFSLFDFSHKAVLLISHPFVFGGPSSSPEAKQQGLAPDLMKNNRAGFFEKSAKSRHGSSRMKKGISTFFTFSILFWDVCGVSE